MAGEITGFQDAGFSAMFIYVRPAEATGAIMDAAEGKLPVYDVAACGPDGRFQTARLSPGAYTLVAEAYRPRRTDVMETGIPLPSAIGTAKVTVSADAPLGPVTIELRPVQR